jgi:hypothetical protein
VVAVFFPTKHELAKEVDIVQINKTVSAAPLTAIAKGV